MESKRKEQIFHVEPEVLRKYKGNIWVFLKCKDRSLSIWKLCKRLYAIIQMPII